MLSADEMRRHRNTLQATIADKLKPNIVFMECLVASSLFGLHGRRLQTDPLPDLENTLAWAPSKQTQWKAFLQQIVPDRQEMKFSEGVQKVQIASPNSQ